MTETREQKLERLLRLAVKEVTEFTEDGNNHFIDSQCPECTSGNNRRDCWRHEAQKVLEGRERKKLG